MFSNREGKPYTDIREPLNEAAQRAGIELDWSEDAGGFICNETYYRSLKASIESYSLPILFIHLPSSDRVPKRRQLEVVGMICSRICTNTK